MAKQSIEKEIEARIQDFIQDLTALVRSSALEAVQGALGSPAQPRKRGPKPRTAPPSLPGAKPKKGKRVRRTAAQIDQTATRIVEFINRNGASRMEELTQALGEPAKDLRGPLKMLLEEKTLTTKGQKRAMQYLPA